MAQSAVFHERKSPWKKLFWAFLLLLALFGAIYFATLNNNDWSWSWKTGVNPAAKAVMATPLTVAIAPAPAAVASTPVVCECKCDCCAQKPVVKKVAKKKSRPVHKKQPVEQFLPNKPAPSAIVAPQEPRYVPVPYNKPTVLNPETGKAVPTMPLGIQPVLTCTQGDTKCAK